VVHVTAEGPYALGHSVIAFTETALGSHIAQALTGDSEAPAPASAPAVVFTVAPSEVIVGHPASLAWSAAGAESCTASGDWAGPRPVTGTESFAPAAAGSYTFVLTCTGPGGDVSQSAPLVVVEAPEPPAARPGRSGTIVGGGHPM
jgi:hypothetical protein